MNDIELLSGIFAREVDGVVQVRGSVNDPWGAPFGGFKPAEARAFARYVWNLANDIDGNRSQLPKSVNHAASALSEFMSAIEESGYFGPELAQKIIVAATPVIVATVTTEGNLWQALLSTLTKTS